MQCFCSGEQVRGDEMVPNSESHATNEYAASLRSSRTGETEQKPDTGNIEEAEISLRESSGLNYEVGFLKSSWGTFFSRFKI